MSDLSWPATRVLSIGKRSGAVPGHLELTDTHLRFRPAGIAAKVQGTPFAVQLKHVAGAGITEVTAGLFKRTRQRLCITLGDGSEQFFEVGRPDDVAEAVRVRLGGAA
ncbi:hypothetical protein [Tsukamurella paurometabola]|uniref:Bacterial Pleckstrin homology domain-containing protein n=1 Tax=Tsukamurella paurometabola TaxID=2061 RepID=A0A3P8L5D0_TSUPA|nr:hypothetical protein [Tsukamurella paurometabola]MBS4104032.1 hypothetical protein [Tsukamurella paurometabola]UEA85409.1 hypothetical protein LK411_11575 [Tsukamurella paurometabola]VDR38031.1 Uncharacterised protein [Tsukamurella paurometabola]